MSRKSDKLKALEYDIDSEFIYVAKCIGAWDDKMSKRLRSGDINRILVNLPILKERIIGIVNQQRLEAYRQGYSHAENDAFIK